jgi:hypothetical protein
MIKHIYIISVSLALLISNVNLTHSTVKGIDFFLLGFLFLLGSGSGGRG